MSARSIHRHRGRHALNLRAPPAQASADISAEPAEQAAQINAILHNRFRMLRFPTELELDFRRETHKRRFRHSVAYALIASIGLYLWSFLEQSLLPTTGHPFINGQLAVVAVVLCAALVGMLFRRPEWVWPHEQIACVGSLAVAAASVWATRDSQITDGASHALALIAIITYATVVVRQRFWYALFSATTVCCAYVLFVAPRGHAENLVYTHSALVISLAMLLGLSASYLYERSQRRSFLFKRLDALRLQQLVQTQSRLNELARTDPLTGIGNRRRFNADIAAAWRQGSVAGHTMALLVIDVDHFKSYNDTYGHPAGDACLKCVAGLINHVASQRGGWAYRVGGEEFAIVMPHAAGTAASHSAHAVRRAIVEAALAHGSSPVAGHLTVSVGIAVRRPQGETDSISQLRRRTDIALYRAKCEGRNQCAFGTDNAPDDVLPAQPHRLERYQVSPAAPKSIADGVQVRRALEEHSRMPGRYLRFAPKLEHLYTRRRETKRPQYLVKYTLGGLVLFNLYLLFGESLTPDIAADNLRWRGLASLLLLTNAVLGLVAMRPWLRETLHSIGMCTLVLGCLLLYSESDAATATNAASAVMLIPFFSVVGGRMAFGSTLVMVIASALGYLVFLHPDSFIDTMIGNNSLTIFVLLCVFILIASYQLEHGARRGFVERLTAHQRLANLESATQRLLQLSTSDPLTGIGNRRRFNEVLEQTWTRARASAGHVGMLIIDIDDFKQYNDCYGHDAGDGCLHDVATAIASVAHDLEGEAFRIGGEEFALLLPSGYPATTRIAAERVRASVAALAIPHTGSRVADTVSVSVGATASPAQLSSDSGALFAEADRALYLAKAQGRNRAAFRNDCVA